jgi:plastocyanin
MLIGIASLAIAVTSASAGGSAPGAVVKAKGGHRNLHYKVVDGSLASGDDLKVVNKTDELHTFSLVAQSALPDSNSDFRHCFDSPAGQHICRWVFKAHKQDNFTPVFDLNNDGFNDVFDVVPNKQQGDSIILRGHPRRVQVTATPNTTLHFMCIIHPNMQGSIDVTP